MTKYYPRSFPGFIALSAMVWMAAGSAHADDPKNQAATPLAKAIAAADRDDPRWRMADVLADRAKVPDKENSALIVDRVLEKLPADWPATERALPGLPPPPTNKAVDAIDKLAKLADDDPLPENLAIDLRLILVEHAEAVALARTLADHRQGNREIKFTPAFIDTLLPKTQGTRSVARLLQLDAALRAHDGDLDGALDSCRAIVNCGRSLGDEPTIISQLVRIAIVSTGIRGTQRVLARGEPSDAPMARLQALLADESTTPFMLSAMKGERAGMDELIQKISTGEFQISELAGNGLPRKADAPRVQVSAWQRASYDNQRAIELEWMTEAVKIMRKPDAEQFALWEVWTARNQKFRETWHARFTATLPLLLTPAIEAASAAQARGHCEQAAAALMLAAERHRRKTGSWPKAAADIDESILPAPIVDPFGDGKPPLMEARDGKLYVYSVGFNRKDDHGAYDIRNWMRGPVDVGGILWDVAKRPKPLSR